MKTYEKIIFGGAALVIFIFSSLGFYLINGEPPIKSLVISGHSHILLFAYGAILFGLLLSKVRATDSLKKILAILFTLTYLGPLDLVYAGQSGVTKLLAYSSPLFMGLFVVLWLWLFVLLMKPTK